MHVYSLITAVFVYYYSFLYSYNYVRIAIFPFSYAVLLKNYKDICYNSYTNVCAAAKQFGSYCSLADQILSGSFSLSVRHLNFCCSQLLSNIAGQKHVNIIQILQYNKPVHTKPLCPLSINMHSAAIILNQACSTIIIIIIVA